MLIAANLYPPSKSLEELEAVGRRSSSSPLISKQDEPFQHTTQNPTGLSKKTPKFRPIIPSSTGQEKSAIQHIWCDLIRRSPLRVIHGLERRGDRKPPVKGSIETSSIREQSFSISNTQGKIQQIERLEINAALDIVHFLACRAWDNKPSSSGRLSST